MSRIVVGAVVYIGVAVALWQPAEAIKPGSCSVELEKARAEIERLKTDLRLRNGELAVVRGQFARCQKKASVEE